MAGLILNWNQRLRTRVPSWSHYARSVWEDPRQATYKLLPMVTSPAARARIGSSWAWFKPRTPSLLPDDITTTRLERLKSDGVVTDMPGISAEHLADICDYFKSAPCHDPYRPHLGPFAWDRVPSLECNMGMYTAEQIVNAPHLIELFNHPHLLALAEAYIGCKPTLDNIGCWWSYGGRVSAKGTQRFHRDFDSIGGFKVFYYLTDVGPDQGPHEYVRGSHRVQHLDTGAAIADDLLWRHYDPRSAVVITGAAGRSFVADTFGIHRGQLPRSGQRLLLSAQYNINVSPHGPAAPLIRRDASSCGLDRYVNRLYVDFR